jgi:CheY-like chemotaxis protein
MTKILVFESEPAFAWELRTELGRLGCTVQIVDDGNAGLQIAANDRPDLVLLSIELPRMNGFSICNKFKKDPHLRDVPLIIMSSDSSEETFEQHRRLKTRAEDYVRKPIALGELVAHIRQLIPIEAAIEPEAIAIEDAIVFDDEIEDLGAPAVATASGKTAEADTEIDDFLGGAFDRLIGDEAPKGVHSVAKMPPSLAPEPPTIPAPPPPAPPVPPIVLAPLPPPPPPPVARSTTSDSTRPARAPSVPPPRSVVTKGPVTTRSVPPPPQPHGHDPHGLSLADAALIEQLRTELAHTKEELGRNRDEVARLELAVASRANVQLLEARPDPDEVVRLRHEVEELKTKLAVAATNAPARGPSREFLDLREALNKKDKEILALRDQITVKDKEVLELRDAALEFEREKADLSDKLSEWERASEENAVKLARLEEERSVLVMRAENFELLTTKLEARMRAQESDAVVRLEAAETEAQSRVQAVEQLVADEKNAKETALASLEQARRAVADVEARLADETTRHGAERERLSTDHAAQVAALEARHAAELRARDEAHAEEVDAAHETEIANLRSAHAEELEQFAAAHASELEKVRQDNLHAVEQLKAEHATQMNAFKAEADERLATRNREFADEWVRGAAELEALHGEAVMKAERDAAERVRAEVVDHYEGKLRELEGKHAAEIEKMRNERDRAIDERDAASRSAVQELDRYVIALGADLQDTRIKLEDTEEQRVALSAEVTKLKSENSELTNRVETELRALKAELETVGAEKDRFVAEAVATASRVTRMRTRWEQDRAALGHAREALTQPVARLQEIESHSIDTD